MYLCNYRVLDHTVNLSKQLKMTLKKLQKESMNLQVLYNMYLNLINLISIYLIL